MKRVIKAATDNVYYWNGVDEVPKDVVNVVIEDGVTEIPERTFMRRYSLETVNIPNSVVTIGSDAFYECKNLAEVTLPANLTVLGEHAFAECSALKSIVVPSGITVLDDVFLGSGLVSVRLVEGLEIILNGAFSCCANLEYVRIPNSVVRIDNGAFAYCENLKDVEIQNISNIDIDSEAFANCYRLKGTAFGDYLESIDPEIFGELKPEVSEPRQHNVKFENSSEELASRIIDCLIDEGTRFSDTKQDENYIYTFASPCAEEVLMRYPEINSATVAIDYIGDPADVDCTELQIGEAYCFFVWEENKVYVDYIPEIYKDSGIAEESGPMN